MGKVLAILGGCHLPYAYKPSPCSGLTHRDRGLTMTVLLIISHSKVSQNFLPNTWVFEKFFYLFYFALFHWPFIIYRIRFRLDRGLTTSLTLSPATIICSAPARIPSLATTARLDWSKGLPLLVLEIFLKMFRG
jgi:hypothetical protein